MQKRMYVYRTADSERCFDRSGLINVVGVTNINLRHRISGKVFLLVVCNYTSHQNLQKTLCPIRSPVKKRGPRQALCLCMQPRKHGEGQHCSHNLLLKCKICNCTIDQNVQKHNLQHKCLHRRSACPVPFFHG